MKLITMDGCERYVDQRGGYNEAGEQYTIRSFIIRIKHQIFLGVQITDREVGACGILGRNETHTGVWWVHLKKTENLQDLGVDGSIFLKLLMNTYHGSVCPGFIWLKTQRIGEVLYIQ